ncbi:MAG: hypothetical protein ABIT64_00040, partial [Lysobacteraceae bacterium]
MSHEASLQDELISLESAEAVRNRTKWFAFLRGEPIQPMRELVLRARGNEQTAQSGSREQSARVRISAKAGKDFFERRHRPFNVFHAVIAGNELAKFGSCGDCF